MILISLRFSAWPSPILKISDCQTSSFASKRKNSRDRWRCGDMRSKMMKSVSFMVSFWEMWIKKDGWWLAKIYATCWLQNCYIHIEVVLFIWYLFVRARLIFTFRNLYIYLLKKFINELNCFKNLFGAILQLIYLEWPFLKNGGCWPADLWLF